MTEPGINPSQYPDLIMCNTLRQAVVIGKTAITPSIANLAGVAAGSTAQGVAMCGRKIV